MIWPSLLISALALMTPGAEECPALQAAHEALLRSSFTCERHLTVKLDGDLKVREVTRITYSDGELAKETVEKEVLDEKVVLEEGAGEAALKLPFECSRVSRAEDGAIELRSSDGTEKVAFVLDPGSGALRPRSWRKEKTKRFLWKKFVFVAVAEYKNFTPAPPADARGSAGDGRQR